MNYGKKGAAKKQRALTSKKAHKKKKIGVAFFKALVICCLGFAVVAFIIGFGFVKGIIDHAPKVDAESVSPEGFATIVYDQDGKQLERFVSSGSNRVYAYMKDIPVDLQHAFVAIEDERFYEHNGIDLKGIVRAGVKGLTTGNFSEGASTITQQLLKNNVFTGWTEEKTFRDKLERKIQEQYLAVKLEQDMKKDDILEKYMNTINLGQNTLGVQSAAHRYFNKSVSKLNLSECAVIAGITQNPSKFNPVTNPKENAKRRKKVLGNMLKHKYISKSEYDKAMNDKVYERIQNVNDEKSDSSIYSYYMDELSEQVIQDLEDQLGYTHTQAYNALYSGGLSIYAAQDSKIQKICDEEMADTNNYPYGTKVGLDYRLTVTRKSGSVENFGNETMTKYFREKTGQDYYLLYSSEDEAKAAAEEYKAAVLKKGDKAEERIYFTPQPQASVTVIDQTTGYVKAVVGGRGKKEASLTLNRATNTLRQPGSTFKVLSAYAPALDNGGMTLATVQDDAPFNYENGRPVKNWYSSGYKGLCTLRYGIEQSLNIVAVKTLTDITPQVGFNYLKNFGFTSIVEKRTNSDGSTFSDIGQPLALGGLTDGVSNLELTAAFAAIGNKGTYTKPIFYTKILDHDGNVLIDNTPETNTVIKDTTAALLTSAMEDVVTKGTGTACRLPNMPVAGKTGTTSSNKDVWFSGFTPYYTCSVWGGYDCNENLPSGSTSYPKTLWRKIMGRIHEDLSRKEFKMPSSLKAVTICKKSGKLAVSGLCDADPRGSMVTTEYFAPGTEPKEVCDCHVSASICGVSGLVATDYCPHATRKTKVFMVRPKGSTGTTDDSKYEMPGECTVHTSPSAGSILDGLFGGKDDDDKDDPDGSEKEDKDTDKDKDKDKDKNKEDDSGGGGISDILGNKFN